VTSASTASSLSLVFPVSHHLTMSLTPPLSGGEVLYPRHGCGLTIEMFGVWEWHPISPCYLTVSASNTYNSLHCNDSAVKQINDFKSPKQPDAGRMWAIILTLICCQTTACVDVFSNIHSHQRFFHTHHILVELLPSWRGATQWVVRSQPVLLIHTLAAHKRSKDPRQFIAIIPRPRVLSSMQKLFINQQQLHKMTCRTSTRQPQRCKL